MLEPMPVQSPFAAGRNQLVADQRLQDVQPVRPFARGRQRRKPELVQSQLIPQKSGHPAGTPLTGTGGTRRSGGPAGVSTTDQEHGRATPETPGVRVHTLTAEEKGAWVDDINARMAALAPIERRAAAA